MSNQQLPNVGQGAAPAQEARQPIVPEPSVDNGSRAQGAAPRGAPGAPPMAPGQQQPHQYNAFIAQAVPTSYNGVAPNNIFIRQSYGTFFVDTHVFPHNNLVQQNTHAVGGAAAGAPNGVRAPGAPPTPQEEERELDRELADIECEIRIMDKDNRLSKLRNFKADLESRMFAPVVGVDERAAAHSAQNSSARSRQRIARNRGAARAVETQKAKKEAEQRKKTAMAQRAQRAGRRGAAAAVVGGDEEPEEEEEEEDNDSEEEE